MVLKIVLVVITLLIFVSILECVTGSFIGGIIFLLLCYGAYRLATKNRRR